ncbi:hypothetical protein QCM77_32795 [Bradyrhizobium sp. SSUT18]|uniref:hypothetical protein n=1 Tax=Bradyrhizobium sp. SSUT18 TaxID=3040602 RepID=UPI002447B8B8|nr:hypothetical protein [Bradyrhizobium sp. SSUT18]MDH2404686.1 hypothetical protein [Bradyrhizobium sp. SSUT18]
MEQLFTMKRLEDFVPAHHPLHLMFGCQDPAPIFEDVFGKALARPCRSKCRERIPHLKKDRSSFALALQS